MLSNGGRFSCGGRVPPQHNPKWFRSVAAGNVVELGVLAAERRQLQALVRRLQCEKISLPNELKGSGVVIPAVSAACVTMRWVRACPKDS